MRKHLPPPSYNPPPMFGLRQPGDWPGALIGYYSPGPSGFAPAHVVLPSDWIGLPNDPSWSIYDTLPDFDITSVRAVNMADGTVYEIRRNDGPRSGSDAEP